MINVNRRGFIKSLSGTAVLPAATPLVGLLMGMEQAAAAQCVNTDAEDYKALVCLYMAGGNDAFATVIPNDTVNRNIYKNLRGGLAHGDNEVLPLDGLAPAGSIPALALHPALTFVRDAFNTPPSTAPDASVASRLGVAVVCGVGPLLQPSDRSTPASAQPPKIFSHNDQTSTWLTGKLEGQGNGWGGNFVKAVDGAGSPCNVALDAYPFRTVAFGQTSPYCQSGNEVSCFAASTSSAGVSKPLGGPWLENHGTFGEVGAKALTDTDLEDVFSGDVGKSRSGHVLESEYCLRLTAAVNNWNYLRSGTTPRLHKPEGNVSSDLAAQLRMVAQMVKDSAAIGVKRQVFFVQIGGFDTHSGQKDGHDKLMTTLNAALDDFYTNKLPPDMLDKVTLFTASEFGRKLIANGDGTDHGWAGHHFVIGASQVQSGIYGLYPTMERTGPHFTDAKWQLDGTLVPAVSVDHYAWQLAKWFGVPEDDQSRKSVLPNYFAPPASPNAPINFIAGTNP